MQSSFKAFVTEKEVDEIKKKRQEEWERVRKPHDPLGKLRDLLIAETFSCKVCLLYVYLFLLL